MINIVITGFMGSGKSTIGKEISKRLSMEFIDTDDLIEKREGIKISEIFDRFGEKYFRKIEREIVASLNKKENSVISTGGKTLLFKRNFNFLSKNGIIITLIVEPEILWERLSGDEKRPIIRGVEKGKFMELYKERSSKYEELPNKINISGLGEEESIEKILKFLTGETKEIDVKVGEKISKIKFKRFLLKNLEDIFPDDTGKIFLICDKRVFDIYSKYLKRVTSNYYLVSGGDRSKNIKNVEKLWKWLLNEKIKRDSVIISMGGGVVGDICGFVSSTILRGVTHYHIPTTLLSMLDSSIGGKNGINFNFVKNAIGTFNPADKVFIDPLFLLSVPEKEMSAGIVEGIKAGLLGDSELLDLIEGNLHLIKNLDLNLIEEILFRSINVKKRIVESDPFEKNLRKFLNLGHTLAHAIESYYRYRISHGEAVGIGLIYALEISERLVFCPSELKERIKNLIKKLGLRIAIRAKREELFKLIEMDKKSTEKGLDFVLLKNLEKPVSMRNIPHKILFDSLMEVIHENSFD